VIDQPGLGDKFAAGRRWRYFPDSAGLYGGNPADDKTALQQLEEATERADARFLVLGWPSFWWLEHYPTFIAHVERKHRCVLRNDNLIVWALSS
jgi:hypothetical protein